MRVMSQSPDPLARMHTMTKRQGKSGTIDVKALLSEDEEFLRALVRTALQEVLEAEMTEVLGAEKGERAAGRQGYRSGYYGRTLITRVGKLELRVSNITPARALRRARRSGAHHSLGLFPSIVRAILPEVSMRSVIESRRARH